MSRAFLHVLRDGETAVDEPTTLEGHLFEDSPAPTSPVLPLTSFSGFFTRPTIGVAGRHDPDRQSVAKSRWTISMCQAKSPDEEDPHRR